MSDLSEQQQHDDEDDNGYESDTPLNIDASSVMAPYVGDMSNCILVTNLPQIPEAKIEKLTNVVRNKIYGKVSELACQPDGSVDPNSVIMPFNKETGE
jgi:hypothetical protein